MIFLLFLSSNKQAPNTLRKLLGHPKDPVVKDKVVVLVYKISCEECELRPYLSWGNRTFTEGQIRRLCH